MTSAAAARAGGAGRAGRAGGPAQAAAGCAGAVRLGPLASVARVVGLLGPAVGLAVVGRAHPLALVPATAHTWYVGHEASILLFPLLALGPWLVLGPLDRRLAGRAPLLAPGPVAVAAGWAVRLLLGLYAVYYGALDLVDGVAASAVVAQGGTVGQAVSLFPVGDRYGHLGASALLVALVLLVLLLVDASRRRGRAVLGPLSWAALGVGSALAVLAGASYLTSHIFYPRGVATVLALGAALVLLDVPARRLRR